MKPDRIFAWILREITDVIVKPLPDKLMKYELDISTAEWIENWRQPEKIQKAVGTNCNMKKTPFSYCKGAQTLEQAA